MTPHGHFGRKKRTQGASRPSNMHTSKRDESLVFSDVTQSSANLPPNNPRPSKKKPQNLPRHIVENRSQMAEGGVLIVSFLIDEKSKTLLRSVRLESRGYLLPNEVRFAHASLQKSARSSYETTLKDVPDIEERDFLKIIKQDLERSSEQLLKKTPLIIPIFHYL